jgi:D-alanine--poly(phosphoribitol) ligase subunit 1
LSHFYKDVISPFLHSSELFAERPAFCIDEKLYSYNQLKERIELLYSLVINSKSEVVGIFTHDHIDTYASIWAIWLAGKSYVPLNPNSPQDLNDRIKNQLDLDLILDANQTSTLQSTSSDKDFWHSIDADVFDDNKIVYVLFTSGSTGVPKGVPITGGNLAGFVDAFWKMGYQLSEQDKGLQMFELTFDLSVMSYLIPQLKGGCVYTVPKDCLKFAYIFDLLTEQELTLALMVPSMLKLLRPYFDEIECPKLKYSLFCGEALHAELIESWSKCIPNARIDNVYGPTENTIFCTYYTYQRGQHVEAHNGVLSIGVSMPNNSCKVFNDDLQLAEPNQIGELCLAGVQLTPGYHKNDELNSMAFFIYDDKESGEKIRYYKTGDLCIQLIDGNINYIGRKDSQVKIQGFRVELSEIEFQAKSAFDSFKNLVCIVIEDKNSNNEIYLVIEGQPFDLTHLKGHLKETLPWYMIPKDILFMETFPLNTSGKIDKKAIKNNLTSSDYTFRFGTLTDIPFIIECIISAEKGNTEIVGLAQLFNLNLEELKKYLEAILDEEIEGCEFSVTNFVIAEQKGKPVAGLCAWIEGENEFDQPSSVLKANLLGRTLGIDKLKELEKHKSVLEKIRISRTPGAHQVEYVHVDSKHRGQNLVKKMIDFSVVQLSRNSHENLISQVEVFSNNLPAIKAYVKLGYTEEVKAISDPEATSGVLPYFEKIQMQKTLSN